MKSSMMETPKKYHAEDVSLERTGHGSSIIKASVVCAPNSQRWFWQVLFSASPSRQETNLVCILLTSLQFHLLPLPCITVDLSANARRAVKALRQPPYHSLCPSIDQPTSFDRHVQTLIKGPIIASQCWRYWWLPA